MPDKWIRVFEHQKIIIGHPVEGGFFEERHLHKLEQFLANSKYPYFQLLPRGILFTHYVGTIQVDELTIEILPKTDNRQDNNANVWQQILFDLLQEGGLWRGEWVSGTHLNIKKGAILEWYCQFFLDETRKLLRRGLLKKYSKQQGPQKALQGRLLLHKQSTETLPIFWTEKEIYHFDHPYNQWLKAALDLISLYYPNQQIRQQAIALSQRFPHFPVTHSLPVLPLQAMDKNYQNALLVAQLLLHHFAPIPQKGKWPLMSILFDMNALFEEYVASQLERYCPPEARVWRQVSTPFWNRRTIRPDLVLEWSKYRLVLDTKWKVPYNSQPGIEDLRQIYVYNEYFSADLGVLLYPGTNDSLERPAIPFAPVKTGRKTAHSCKILTAAVVNADGKLNRMLGKELWEKLAENRTHSSPEYLV